MLSMSQAVLRAARRYVEKVFAMTQRELERELANMTGESIATIRSRGFGLVEPPELEPLVVDWDEAQQVEPVRRPFAKRRVHQAA